MALDGLPTLNTLPKSAIAELSVLAFELGLAQMRDLIQASSSADLLLPLTTAIELELGLEPRVAKEVEEVAQDIRDDWNFAIRKCVNDKPGAVGAGKTE